jgi:hypothetical protein
MMGSGTYKLHRRAVIALNQLADAEQQRVKERLSALVEIPVTQWPAAWVKPLQDNPPLYLVRVDDSLRLIVQPEDSQRVELMDIVRHETLVESFSSPAAKNGD